MDKLTCMQTFAKVGELKSFTRAADALELSRAVVSAQIADLERHLGARLLHRTTRKVALTHDGERFLEHCQRILGAVQAAEESLKADLLRPQGRLRVDVPIAFGRQLLVPALPQFTARYPELKLEIQLNDRVVDLLDEQVDVAIRLGPVRAPDLVARRICSTRWFTCASPDYLGRAGRPRTPEELRRHRLIGFLGSGGRPRKWIFEHRGQRQTPTLPFALAFNMADAQLSAALRGNGIVQTVDMLVAEQLRSERLERVLPEYSTAGPAISAVFPASQRNSVKVRVFADFAADMLQRLRRELDANAPA